MIKEIEILLVNINNKRIGCMLDEVERVVNIPGDMDAILPEEREIYRLGEILKMPCRVEYNSLLLLKREPDNIFIVAIPAITDIIILKTSRILGVPDYLRRKQDPFFVWGFFTEKNEMTMLITFAYFNKAIVKDGYHEL